MLTPPTSGEADPAFRSTEEDRRMSPRCRGDPTRTGERRPPSPSNTCISSSNMESRRLGLHRDCVRERCGSSSGTADLLKAVMTSPGTAVSCSRCLERQSLALL